MVIDINSTIEIRVAAGCCVGIGPFTDVIDSTAGDARTEETLPTTRKQPKITEVPSSAKAKHLCYRLLRQAELVTATTADVEWTPPAEIPPIRFRYHIRYILLLFYFKIYISICYRYHIRYWMDGQQRDDGHIQSVGSSATSCRLEKLAPDTKYFFDIHIISTDQKKTSLPTETKEFHSKLTNIGTF